jgi:hypothetical protein
VETSGYSGGFVPGPSPVPSEETTTVSPLDPAWQPPAAAAQPVPPAFLPATPPMPDGYQAVADPAAGAAVSAALAEMPPPASPPAQMPPPAMPPAQMPPPAMPPAAAMPAPVAAASVAPAPAPVAAAPVAAAPPAPAPVAAAPAPVAVPAAPADFAPTAWEEPAAEAPAGVGIADSEAFAGAYSRATT